MKKQIDLMRQIAMSALRMGMDSQQAMGAVWYECRNDYEFNTHDAYLAVQDMIDRRRRECGREIAEYARYAKIRCGKFNYPRRRSSRAKFKPEYSMSEMLSMVP